MGNLLFVVIAVLSMILIGLGLNWLYVYVMGKRSATFITQDEFNEKMRKAQVIDVREKATFDAGHILGARNISYPMIKQNPSSLRKDQPIFLYDQTEGLSARTANLLRKQGYTNLYILKGGYNKWSGKTKQVKK